jgi:serpin B
VQPFDERFNKDADFYNQDGSTSVLPTMRMTSSYNYSKEEQFALLELPFGNEAFSMLTLLPDKGVSIDDIIGKLDGESWETYLTNITNGGLHEIAVKLPRFKIEYESNLNDALKAMGMTAVFSESADLSLIHPTAPLFVSKVKQKTFVEVNENGMEAAAATVIEVVGGSGPSYNPPPPPDFTVDRPFIFFVKEKSTGTIFFAGVIRNLK